MIRLALAAAAAVALAGCASPNIKVNAKFDEAQAKDMMAAGRNQVKGSGFMRQQGGGVVTCAGEEVAMFPATPYALEWSKEAFKRPDGGYRNHVEPIDPDEPKGFRTIRRTAVCDAQGNFHFDDVADGRYFFGTLVKWTIPSSFGPLPQGGYVARVHNISGGRLNTITVSPPN